ncbi:MAG: hypothetical protein ACTSSG_14255 [Candidatus Heimdallarchaeaceae archaeon]
MKEIYYYIRDEKNRPMITVCLLEETNYYNLTKKYTRGVALCSEKDIPCKKVGRKIAKQRASYALENEFNSCATKENITLFHFKSCYIPALTEYENKLLNFKRK